LNGQTPILFDATTHGRKTTGRSWATVNPASAMIFLRSKVRKPKAMETLQRELAWNRDKRHTPLAVSFGRRVP
jgi:hypothetical protein